MKHSNLLRKTIPLLFACITSMSQAQDFYDLSTIQTIKIVFKESNWDALLDAQKAGDEDYIMAQSVTINDVVFDSVGVKYKGNSTYNANQKKNPFHIELDTYKDQNYQSYTDIKLSNVSNDPSFVREVLSYKILRQYMDAPKSNYANVYVNGTLIGLYSNSEAINKTFLKDRFDSKNNTFIKCNPPAGAGPTTSDYPNLVYLGEDSSKYYASYELKSDYGWNELIDLTDTLKNTTTQIENILDVDRAIWMLAFDNVLVNLDSYIGGFAQNYYLYRDQNNRFLPIVWDLNESFGRFAQTGSGNLNSTATKQKMSHLLHETDDNYPLIQKILSIPMYKRMYLAHYKTILLENFDNDAFYTDGLAMQNTIKTAVQADGNKFFTYQNFLDNLASDVTTSTGGPGGGSATPGIKNLMDTRNDYLLALSDFTQTAPTIGTITLSNALPVINTTISITANITNATKAYLGYRADTEDRFIRYEMFDDGTHNDGNAGDGVYGVAIKIADSYSQYYIYSENNNAGIFSPKRAEYEYHAISAITAETTIGNIVINEFMASNKSTVADQNGEYDDWIELYNNSSTDISLDGYYLSDDKSNLKQWAFPSSASIKANDYLIIWADKDTLQAGLHASFKLSASNETIYLVNILGEIVDQISYNSQVADSSFSRVPNGTGSFEKSKATYASSNDLINGINSNDAYNATQIHVFPNPSSGSFTLLIESKESLVEPIVIYNTMGQKVFETPFSASTEINTSSWSTGIYFTKIGSVVEKIMVE